MVIKIEKHIACSGFRNVQFDDHTSPVFSLSLSSYKTNLSWNFKYEFMGQLVSGDGVNYVVAIFSFMQNNGNLEIYRFQSKIYISYSIDCIYYLIFKDALPL
jgi:hypothetical protein